MLLIFEKNTGCTIKEDLYKIEKIIEPVKKWEREYNIDDEVFDGFG